MIVVTQVRTDLLEWWPLLSEGGTFCGANYSTEGPHSFLGRASGYVTYGSHDLFIDNLPSNKPPLLVDFPWLC